MLSQQEMRQFEQDGYLVFRQLAARAECEEMRSVATAHVQDATPPVEYEAEVGYPGAPRSLDAPGGRTIRRLRAAYHRHPVFAGWARDPRLVQRLAQLFGEDIVLTLAHHNCVMTKHPDFGTATGWHRDIRYWSFAQPDLISVWLALGGETAGNGALKVIPGSHRLALAPGQLDELDFLRPDVEANQPLFAQGITLELQQGDVVFFHSRLFHAAGRNGSDRVKMSLVFAYHGHSNHPLAGSKSAAAGEVELGS
ncbi:MAG TPA: phytanoyl-CoA dioxygenase family protein [Paucimonas sp.]|nr:phytanoyl-CoA dioxygenase family protein [Paucimonas sp.]